MCHSWDGQTIRDVRRGSDVILHLERGRKVGDIAIVAGCWN